MFEVKAEGEESNQSAPEVSAPALPGCEVSTVSGQDSGQSSELSSRGKNKGRRYLVGKRFFPLSIKVSLAFVLAILEFCPRR